MPRSRRLSTSSTETNIENVKEVYCQFFYYYFTMRLHLIGPEKAELFLGPASSRDGGFPLHGAHNNR